MRHRALSSLVLRVGLAVSPFLQTAAHANTIAEAELRFTASIPIAFSRDWSYAHAENTGVRNDEDHWAIVNWAESHASYSLGNDSGLASEFQESSRVDLPPSPLAPSSIQDISLIDPNWNLRARASTQIHAYLVLTPQIDLGLKWVDILGWAAVTLAIGPIDPRTEYASAGAMMRLTLYNGGEVVDRFDNYREVYYDASGLHEIDRWVNDVSLAHGGGSTYYLGMDAYTWAFATPETGSGFWLTGLAILTLEAGRRAGSQPNSRRFENRTYPRLLNRG